MRRLLSLALAGYLALAAPASAELRVDWSGLPPGVDQKKIEQLLTQCTEQYLTLSHADLGPVDFQSDNPVISLSFRKGLRDLMGWPSAGVYRPHYKRLDFDSDVVADEARFRRLCTHEFKHVYDDEKGLLPKTNRFYSGLQRFHEEHPTLSEREAFRDYLYTPEGRLRFEDTEEEAVASERRAEAAERLSKN